MLLLIVLFACFLIIREHNREMLFIESTKYPYKPVKFDVEKLIGCTNF